MKAIFEACTLWKKDMCNKAVLSELYNQEPQAKNDSSVQSYNQICQECKYPLIIEEKNCPICGNRDLDLSVTKGQCGFKLVYNYNCEECGRILYAHSKFD